MYRWWAGRQSGRSTGDPVDLDSDVSPSTAVHRRGLAGNPWLRTGTPLIQRWHHHALSSAEQAKLRAAVLRLARPAGGDRAVDLGCGTGVLALALAPVVGSVLCVDVNHEMLQRTRTAAASAGLTGIRTMQAELGRLDLPAFSVDLVVSSFALHHLTDAQKKALLIRASGWLAPGGRLLICDWMFGRGRTRRDRAVLRTKARRMLRTPGGVRRLVLHAVRFGLLHRGPERPASLQFWLRALVRAGFADVRCVETLGAAAIVSAQAPIGNRPVGAGDPHYPQ